MAQRFHIEETHSVDAHVTSSCDPDIRVDVEGGRTVESPSRHRRTFRVVSIRLLKIGYSALAMRRRLYDLIPEQSYA